MARIGLIGGTGLDQWGGEAEERTLDTPFGPPSDAVFDFAAGGHRLLFLPRHRRDHAIAPHRVNYRANIQAMQQLGADAVIAVNAVGGITRPYGPGVLAVPDQLVDYTWDREHTYSSEDDKPVLHAEFGEPFDPALRRELLEAARAAALDIVDGGCLGVTQGPRLETHAEVIRLERDGCDLVGMTSMPEAALARELELPYVSLCVVANRAAGVCGDPITMEAIEATLAEAMVRVRSVLSEFMGRLPRG